MKQDNDNKGFLFSPPVSEYVLVGHVPVCVGERGLRDVPVLPALLLQGRLQVPLPGLPQQEDGPVPWRPPPRLPHGAAQLRVAGGAVDQDQAAGEGRRARRGEEAGKRGAKGKFLKFLLILSVLLEIRGTARSSFT